MHQSQRLILTEMSPGLFTKAECVLSLLRWFYYHCPRQMRLFDNNRTDSDSSDGSFSS